MKNKSFGFKLFVGLCISSFLIGCKNKNEEKPAEQKDEPVTPTDQKTYDDGYVDGYIAGYNEGKTNGLSEGYSQGKIDGQAEGYNQGKEDAQKERESQSIHTDKQLEYLNNSDYSILPASVSGESEQSRPAPLKFQVQESPLYNLDDITSTKLRISETDDFTKYIEVEGDAEHRFEVYNLKINTSYYYYYWAVTAAGTYYSEVKEVFVKNEAPRLLNIDGVKNARDVGGWKIKGQDKYTVQGKMFRTGMLSTISTTYITPEGKEAIKALGIKTEIDLRNSGDNPPTSSAVDGVAYRNIPLDHSSNAVYFTDASSKQNVKNVLEMMADSDNYPLMFHCRIGTDRTGFISFIVNALLGVEEECLFRDYMMSNFSDIGGPRNAASINEYIDQLKTNYDGATDLSVGAKNYMSSIGASDADINNIKTIMLGA